VQTPREKLIALLDRVQMVLAIVLLLAVAGLVAFVVRSGMLNRA
jgi:hypothetical protein